MELCRAGFTKSPVGITPHSIASLPGALSGHEKKNQFYRFGNYRGIRTFCGSGRKCAGDPNFNAQSEQPQSKPCHSNCLPFVRVSPGTEPARAPQLRLIGFL